MNTPEIIYLTIAVLKNNTIIDLHLSKDELDYSLQFGKKTLTHVETLDLGKKVLIIYQEV